LYTDPREPVIEFLLDAKRAVQAGDDSWIFLSRQKNIETVAALEFTMEDVKREMLSLSVTDYCSGPMDDPEIRGAVWIFGKAISDKEVYIKLKLWGDKTAKGLRVISFHWAEKPLIYAFKE
jgi:hypothetical protein